MSRMANNADSEQTAPLKEQSVLGLHCLCKLSVLTNSVNVVNTWDRVLTISPDLIIACYTDNHIL